MDQQSLHRQNAQHGKTDFHSVTLDLEELVIEMLDRSVLGARLARLDEERSVDGGTVCGAAHDAFQEGR